MSDDDEDGDDDILIDSDEDDEAYDDFHFEDGKSVHVLYVLTWL